MTDDDWTAFVSAIVPRDVGFDADANWFVENAPGTWPDRFRCGRDDAIRAAAAVVEMLLPEWEAGHPRDTAPIRAVAAVRKTPSTVDEDLLRHAKALAKACTASRARSVGYEHRIAEAARELAYASSAGTDVSAMLSVGRALAEVEEHLLYRLSVEGQYGREMEARRRMLRRAVGDLWRTKNAESLGTTVMSVAQAIYAEARSKESASNHLPIVADALEEAGCSNQQLLAHCRGARPAWWILELLLAKD
jgi:hypothetical protein